MNWLMGAIANTIFSYKSPKQSSESKTVLRLFLISVARWFTTNCAISFTCHEWHMLKPSLHMFSKQAVLPEQEDNRSIRKVLFYLAIQFYCFETCFSSPCYWWHFTERIWRRNWCWSHRYNYTTCTKKNSYIVKIRKRNSIVNTTFQNGVLVRVLLCA